MCVGVLGVSRPGVRRVQKLVDLAGEVLGGGSGEADGDDDGVVVAAEPDEPCAVRGSPLGAGGAAVDLGAQWLITVVTVVTVLSGLVVRGLGSVAQVGGGVGGGCPGVLGDVAGLFGEGGIGAGVLVGDPGEQVGLVAEQLGSVGGVAAEGR
jgi:hypothetical protein